jgi:cyclic pyranopterin phosphate synthase
MVNVAKKPISRRVAIAKGEVQMAAKTLELIKENKMKKGDVLGVAQVAGIQGAKRTADLIPFCHPIQMDHISVGFSFDDNLPGVQIEGRAECDARTGVEMEALTAVSVAALTIYDMAKSADKTMRIGAIRLVKKTGGQSGDVSNE